MVRIQDASLDDAHLAAYRGVSDPVLLRKHGLFVAEGRAVVRRLLMQSRLQVQSLLLSPAAFTALEDCFHRLPPNAVVYRTSTDQFETITGVNVHRGCLALGFRPAATMPPDLVQHATTVVVLESLADADNVGGVFRNVQAFGADAVLLDPSSCDPLYRKAIRTSGAASLLVPFGRLQPWPTALDTLRQLGFEIVAMTPRLPSAPLEQWVATRGRGRVALLFGAEGRGLSEGVMAQADSRIRIPMLAGVDSVNVAVAAGITLSRLHSAGC